MTKKSPRCWLFAVLCLLTVFSLRAQDCFLQISTITGDSSDPARYPGFMNALTFSGGITATGTVSGGGGSSGRAMFTDLTVTKKVDRASPRLHLVCAQGAVLQSATLILRQPGGTNEFYRIALTSVLVSRVMTEGDKSPGLPLTESISFNFETIRWTYRPTNPNGSGGTIFTAGWDRVNNRAL